MTLIALVGVDGAGKTTIARLVKSVGERPAKYLYMGTAIQSSNTVLLPSPLVQMVKRVARRSSQRKKGRSGDAELNGSANGDGVVQRGRIGVFLRVVNRVAEEWYRQLVASWYQLRGFVVVCDRHFLFEYATWRTKEDPGSLQRLERWHMWLLGTFYPPPDLVIMLDGPIEIFQQRKPEWTIEKLEKYRAAVLKLRATVNHFYQVDATRPVEEVLGAVEAIIDEFVSARSRPLAVQKRSKVKGHAPKEK